MGSILILLLFVVFFFYKLTYNNRKYTGQMSAEDAKKISLSKTKLRYRAFSKLYLVSVLPALFIIRTMAMLSGGSNDSPSLQSQTEFFAYAQMWFILSLVVCGIGGLISVKRFSGDVPSIGSKIFFWFPIVHFSFNTLLFIHFFVF